MLSWKYIPVNDLETGVQDFKIPIYHFKRHCKRIARHNRMRRGKAEFKVHPFSNRSSSKTQTRIISFIIQQHGRARDKPTIKQTYVAEPILVAQQKRAQQKRIRYWIELVVIRRAYSGTGDCVVPQYPPPNQTGQ